jgi:hypothetical protein
VWAKPTIEMVTKAIQAVDPDQLEDDTSVDPGNSLYMSLPTQTAGRG